MNCDKPRAALLGVDVGEADGPEADLHGDEYGGDALAGEGLQLEQGAPALVRPPVQALAGHDLILRLSHDWQADINCATARPAV